MSQKKTKRDSRPQPEPTPFKSAAQKAYKSMRRKNDIYSTTAGHKNLGTGSPYNQKTKRAGTDRLRFEEVLEVDPEGFRINDTGDSTAQRWMHGEVDRKETTRLLEGAGMGDGLFLVRVKKGQAVISMCCKGVAEHHLLKQGVDGVYTVNDGVLSKSCTTLKELIDHLHTDTESQLGVLLGDYVPAGGGAALEYV